MNYRAILIICFYSDVFLESFPTILLCIELKSDLSLTAGRDLSRI